MASISASARRSATHSRSIKARTKSGERSWTRAASTRSSTWTRVAVAPSSRARSRSATFGARRALLASCGDARIEPLKYVLSSLPALVRASSRGRELRRDVFRRCLRRRAWARARARQGLSCGGRSGHRAGAAHPKAPRGSSPPNDVTTKVLLRGQLIVRAAAQRDVLDARRSASRVRVLVMKLEPRLLATALATRVDIRAARVVALPDGT